MSVLWRRKFSLLALTVGALFLSAVVSYANWVAPLKAPPTCDAGSPGCDPPINVGSAFQSKAGALGIGSVLVVNGGLVAIGPGAGTGGRLNLFAAGADRDLDWFSEVETNRYRIRSGDNVERFTILSSNGYVGINNSAPADRLEISGSGNMGIRISNTGDTPTDFSAIRFLQGGGVRGLVYSNQGDFYIRTSGGSGQDLILQSAGANVGIGIVPAAANRLDVSGKIHATGDVCTDLAGGKCLSTVGGGGGPGSVTTSGGTVNVIPKWTGATTLGNSNISDDGSTVKIGSAAGGKLLDVYGRVAAKGSFPAGFLEGEQGICIGAGAGADCRTQWPEANRFGGAFSVLLHGDHVTGGAAAVKTHLRSAHCKNGNPLNGEACYCPAGYSEVPILRAEGPVELSTVNRDLYICVK